VQKDQTELWHATEKKIASAPQRGVFDAEDSRTSGLSSIRRRAWSSCLLRLDEALNAGHSDVQTLDAFGEAAYRANLPEALIPYAGNYKHPAIAVHMARALMILGEAEKARHYLDLADESLLKTAVRSLLGIRGSIEATIEAMVTRNFPEPGASSPLEKLYYPQFWQALATVADTAGRLDLVTIAEQRVKEQAYDNPVIHYNQAIRFLARGEFRAGWLLYEWRLAPASQCPLPTALEEIPMWEGERVAGKKLLIVVENGLGDQIFGLRFVRALSAEGARIEVAVSRVLMPLAQSSFPELTIHAHEEIHEPGYWEKRRPDFWCYSLSVPARAGIFEPGKEIPTGPYLKALESLVSRNRERILAATGARGGLPVRGLVWHGDIQTPAMRTRAYSLAEFLAESRVLSDPCVLINLQKDATEAELAELTEKARAAGCVLINAQDELVDFGYTAAWMRNLDRMYSCDTASAHTAGALGVPTTVLIRNKSIWCWLPRAGDDRAVWYDSVQIRYALTPEISFMFELPESENPGQALLDTQH
jgi:hypothetical protein